MMDRRSTLSWAGKLAAGLGALAMPGCRADGQGDEGTASARLAGFHMPLESAPHERTIMQWPVSLAVYDRAGLEAVQRAIALIANTVSEFEPVAMLAAADAHTQARRLLGDKVELWNIPTDDLWARDSGPTFVRDGRGRLAVADIRFNGWGNKQPHSNDGRIAGLVAKRLGVPLLETGLIGEQGGVEHDGAGTLMAHASCWVNPNRNRASERAIGDRLLMALGGRKMIWAPGIKGADITDYHIDALARFVGPGHVLIQIGDAVDRDDPWSVAAHRTLAILESATGADGKPLRITRIDDPTAIRSKKRDFVSSYVNYYVCNDAVIGAQFGDPAADEAARETLTRLFPNRQVIALNVDALGDNGGGIHCATQQQPKAA